MTADPIAHDLTIGAEAPIAVRDLDCPREFTKLVLQHLDRGPGQAS